jgi:hypothetical protein
VSTLCCCRLRAVEAARAEAEARAAAHAAGEEVVRMQLAKAQVRGGTAVTKMHSSS